MQDKLSKAMQDMKILIDTYGEQPVLDALADIAGLDAQTAPVSNLQEQKNPLSPAAIAAAMFDILVKTAGSTGKLAGTGIKHKLAKSIDQDVHISSQGPVLKVADESLAQMLKQTNALIKRTNELLSSAAVSIEDSNKELSDIEVSIDDAIASQTGDSAIDIASRQAAGLPPEKDDEEEIS